MHDFERFRADDSPPQLIRSWGHCQKKTPGFDPVREPFPAQFAFFKLHRPRENPDEHRLRNSRDDQTFFDALAGINFDKQVFPRLSAAD
jgi:hypothetical protein